MKISRRRRSARRITLISRRNTRTSGAVLPEIDEKIAGAAKGWKLERIGKSDLSILRLGVYEMLYDDDIPVGVAINEAVELAKSFGENESASFINGILGKLARQ